MKSRLSREQLVDPYTPGLIVNCSYELRLGAEVYVTGERSDTKRELARGEQVRIPPGQFANLLTEEVVKVPADAIGLISAKFRWKQRGLVNVSGFHVDPGYRGRILFSVFNAGPTPVVVERGDPLFLLWYCGLDRVTRDTYNRPPRMTITSEDVSHLQGDVATPQALAVRVGKLETIIKAAGWVGTTILAALIVWGVQMTLADDGNGTPLPTTSTTVADGSLDSPGPLDDGGGPLGNAPSTTDP